MNDKRLIISALALSLFCFPVLLSAQHPTARWMAGHTTGGISEVANGNFYLFAARSKFSVEISPQVSKFIRSHVQVGVQMGFSFENGDGLTQVVGGLSPFYRMNYRGIKKWTPYIEAGGGPFYVFNNDFEGFGVVGHIFYGLDYFLLERVAIGGRLGAVYSRFNGLHTVGVPLRFGIQLLLGD